ncbi:LlaJI family restriction endonuclease (plasmid) [Chryseomicrobium palamuruense]
MGKCSNYFFVNEYQEYENNFSPDLVKQMIYSEICSLKKNKIKFKVVGILVYGNTFIVIFPKGYKMPTDEISKKKHTYFLIQTLLKYKRENDLDLEEAMLLGNDDGENDENLHTAIQLITDFIQNGIINKSVTIKSSDFRNIDWPVTINKKHPVFTNDSVLYSDTVSSRNINDRQHLLLQLHSYCVYKSMDKYGWLFNLTTEDIYLNKQEIPCDISFAINFLMNEMNTTFVERELKVIRLIKEFLIGIDFEDTKDKIDFLVTPHFHYVWEVMCSTNFNNQYKTLKSIIPKLNWDIDTSAMVQAQRPDIMFLREEKLYILDAKYYDVDFNLPGWKDVVKQLFYALTIIKNIESDRLVLSDKLLEADLKRLDGVENLFLFPSGDSAPVKKIGKVRIEGNDDLNDISAYKVNTLLIMKCYLGLEKYDFTNELIQLQTQNLVDLTIS